MPSAKNMKTVRFEESSSNSSEKSSRHAQGWMYAQGEQGEADSMYSYSERPRSEDSGETVRLSKMSQVDLNVGFSGSYATELMKLAAQAGYRREKEEIQRSWEVVRRSRMWHKSMELTSGAARVRPVVPLPPVVRNVLHELQLVWLGLQLITLMWLCAKLDFRCRLHDPIPGLPSYMGSRMPWIPAQYSMHLRLGTILIFIGCVYLPCSMAHFVYVLDDLLDETPLQLARKVEFAHRRKESVQESRRWSLDPRFDQFRRPRRRQWATTIMLVLSTMICLWIVGLLVSDYNQSVQTKRWHRDVFKWLSKMQRRYFANNTNATKEDNPRTILDTIHALLQCCGANGYEEWKREHIVQPEEEHLTSEIDSKEQQKRGNQSERSITPVIPFSCCRWNNGSTCDHINGGHSEHLYTRGCTNLIVNQLLLPWMRTVTHGLVPLGILMKRQNKLKQLQEERDDMGERRHVPAGPGDIGDETVVPSTRRKLSNHPALKPSPVSSARKSMSSQKSSSSSWSLKPRHPSDNAEMDGAQRPVIAKEATSSSSESIQQKR
ncbi:unnamed protein product [Dicrocoelium dendriticum]|nr:unnamed protein product [Dicrocoelium dendriticum]